MAETADAPGDRGQRARTSSTSKKKSTKSTAAAQTTSPARAEPLRRRVSVPQADVSTQQWWDAQDDPSTSVRLLIHDEIERNGYTDRVNRPVEQLPRRGRPPKAETTETSETTESSEPTQSVETEAVVAEAAAPQKSQYLDFDAELGEPTPEATGVMFSASERAKISTRLDDETSTADETSETSTEDDDDGKYLDELIG